MQNSWYPNKKEELEELLDNFLIADLIKLHNIKRANGIIVPHAGYSYSGQVAAKAYPYIKGAKKAVILAPSHYFPIDGAVSHDAENWETPLGKIKITKNDFHKAILTDEHAIDNQVPFLQKMGVKEILPLVVGHVSLEKAREIADRIADFEGVFVVSTDLSHFLPYDEAKIRDKQTIRIIENLDLNKADKIDACGIYPLFILMQLCKLKNWKPKLIEYKNSGDITGEKESVVGYASFVF